MASSDSDGPPPLVDSSSSDGGGGAVPAQNLESSESDDDDDASDWWELFAARQRGDRPGARAQNQFMQMLQDMSLQNQSQQEMERNTQRRQMLALQDTQRSTFHSNYKHLLDLKKEAIAEQNVETRCVLLTDARDILQDLLTSPGIDSQRTTVEMVGADIYVLLAEAMIDLNRHREGLDEVRKAEKIVDSCHSNRRGNQISVKRKLVEVLILRTRAHLQQGDEEQARSCASRIEDLGGQLPLELVTLLEAADLDSEDDEPTLAPVLASSLPEVAPTRADVPTSPSAKKASKKESAKTTDAVPKAKGSAVLASCSQRCRKCNMDYAVGKKAKARHEKHECPQRKVTCPDCNSQMIAMNLEKHAEKCNMRPVVCHVCGDAVPLADLEDHQANECSGRVAECEYCQNWTGQAFYLEEHWETCPKIEVMCPDCHETMPQYEMQSHFCQFFQSNDNECQLCAEPLASKVPALFLHEREEDGKIVRACGHVCLDVQCAQIWKIKCKQQSKETDKASRCPICRTQFSDVAALSDWLRDHIFFEDAFVSKQQHQLPKTSTKYPEISETKKEARPKKAPPPLPTASIAKVEPMVAHPPGAPDRIPPPPARLDSLGSGYCPSPPPPPPPPKATTKADANKSDHTLSPAILEMSVKQLRPRPPLPKPQHCRRFETHYISPLDIHFTHNNISERFMAFQKGDKLVQPTLLETLRECLDTVVPDRVEMLEVLWHEGRIHLAGTFNRRLCVWRLLAIFFPEKFYRVKVKFVPESQKTIKFCHKDGSTKYSTECDGNWIQIRENRAYVGKRRYADPGWETDEWWKFDPGIQWPEAEKLIGRYLKHTRCP